MLAGSCKWPVLPGKHPLYVLDEALLFFQTESDGGADAQVLRIPRRGEVFEQLEHLAEYFDSLNLRLNRKCHNAPTNASLHEGVSP